MPRYDFRCTTCDERLFDFWLSNWRDAVGHYQSILPPCPACGTTEWEKLPSAPNFSIKGYNAKNGYGRKE